MNEQLYKILKPAYDPCLEFAGVCKEMLWKPACGHVPRGYYGALGELEEVELVLVFAEPGDPYRDEEFNNIEATFDYVGRMFRTSKDKFHKNVRYILELCWPELNIEERFRKVWMTESVLCSAKTEAGYVPVAICNTCGKHYLKPQLDLLRSKNNNVLVVAMGRKAEERLKRQGWADYLRVSSPANREGKKSSAKESWQKIPERLKKRQ